MLRTIGLLLYLCLAKTVVVTHTTIGVLLYLFLANTAVVTRATIGVLLYLFLDNAVVTHAPYDRVAAVPLFG